MPPFWVITLGGFKLRSLPPEVVAASGQLWAPASRKVPAVDSGPGRQAARAPRIKQSGRLDRVHLAPSW